MFCFLCKQEMGIESGDVHVECDQQERFEQWRADEAVREYDEMECNKNND